MRKKLNTQRKRVYILSLLVITLFSSIFLNISLSVNLNDGNFDNIDSLKHSAGEIAVMAPGNETLSKPADGYYPGYYGFDNETVGSVPGGWIDDSDGSNYIAVIDNLDGHNKVLRCVDSSTTNATDAKTNIFPGQENGTIEFWFRTNNQHRAHYFGFYNESGGGFLFYVELVYNHMKFSGSEGIVTLFEMGDFDDDTWYHLAIHFEASTGRYRSLDQYEVYIEANGKTSEVQKFANNLSSINQMRFWSYGEVETSDFYFDAFGFSWDPYYRVGDNKEEGLLLNYVEQTSLDWRGYSLDGQQNRTVYGNITISVPENGVHTIQMFGSYNGTTYQSYINTFTVNFLKLLTPIEKTYVDAPAGLPLTYKTFLILDWVGYSLDGALNITIPGNTTLPEPSDGIHTIQVFGNDSQGNIFSSQIHTFTYLSSVDINITTPQNQSNISAMDYYYPGSYGFECDDPGSGPKSWHVGTPPSAGGGVQVISYLDEHNNVLEIRKIEGDSYQENAAVKFESGATSGTIEFWIRKNTQNVLNDGFFITPSGPGGTISLIIGQDRLYYGSWGSKTEIVSGINKDTWYHMRIDFDIAQGYQVQFNGIWYGGGGGGYQYAFNNNPTSIEELWFKSFYSADYSDYSIYLDSVSYSWDPNYYIGDLLNEGILVSYDSNVEFDWTGYSFDGETNVTILGNTTIPMPSDGLHTIQITGTSSDTPYKSDISNFTVENDKILIVTPYITTYTSPDSGYYPATYGFENDLSGARGTDIKFIDEYYGQIPSDYTEIKTRDNWYGHKNTLSMFDAQIGYNTWGVHNIDDPQTSGTIEFYSWANKPTSGSSAKRFYIQFRSIDNTIAFQMIIRLMAEKIQYYDGTTWQDLANTSPEVWYHHKVSFDCDVGINGQFTWIVSDEHGNEISRVENIEFENDLDTIDEIYLESTVSDYGGTTCWDAFGFSWDPNYNIGDNLNEGLLLSYENNLTMDWTGYSLDGAANITITGNTTIPIPMDGDHTIQIHANKSNGYRYSTDVRSFSVNYWKPIIFNMTYGVSVYQGSETTFSWNVWEHYNDYYEIYRNSTLIKTAGYINGSLNTFSEMNWTLGDLSYSIIAYDDQGKNDTYQFIISVLSRVDNREFMAPNVPGQLNLMSSSGIFIYYKVTAIAFLTVERQGFIFPALSPFSNNRSQAFFYKFTIYDASMTENESMINILVIRFYYNPEIINIIEKLRIYHYNELTDLWEWETEATINTEFNYIEINVTSLSYFCLAEFELFIPPALSFFELILVIIFLSVVVVSVPSTYTIVSKRKKKKELQRKSLVQFKPKGNKKLENKVKLESTVELTRKIDPSSLLMIPSEIRKKAAKIEGKRALKTQNPSIHKKIARKTSIISEPTETGGNFEELREIEKTENEMGIYEQEEICQIHKGPLIGLSYHCPKCKTKYCVKCAIAIMNSGEGCWTCKTPINVGSQSSNVKQNKTDILNPLTQNKLHEIFSEKNAIDRLITMSDMNISLLSADFMEKVDKFEWKPEEKRVFMKEMIGLAHEERELILSEIIQYNNDNNKSGENE